MSLKLYNTLSKEKEVFTPVDNNNIRMYVCGPTLYNNPHIGNFRPIVIFDILFRLLQNIYEENKVTYVRNITDIDDKIINTSKELSISAEELVKKFKKTFREDLVSLNILEPTKEPSATEYIDQMVAMISDLISKGFAYESNKHVLFESKKYKDYGKLSRLSPKDIISGARVEVADYKKIQRTLCYGSHLKTVSLFGKVHGAKEDLGGIWNVLPCPMKYWDQTLIFTEVA